MLDVKNLTYSYPKRRWKPVLQDFSLTLKEGGIYGLLGPNGSGKSTLLYLLSGILQPQQGTVTLDGVSTWKRSTETLRQIMLVPEEVTLPDLSLDNFRRYYGAMYPTYDDAVMTDCLTEFGMLGTHSLTGLSMGQKKKVFISFAIATSTPVLLMDEPTNGLDIPAKAAFRRLVLRYSTEEKIVLISTHQVRDLEQLLDHILIMNDCRLVLETSVSALQDRFRFVRGVPLAELGGAVFSSAVPGGYNAMLPNPQGEITDPDLELLFVWATTARQECPVPPAAPAALVNNVTNPQN